LGLAWWNFQRLLPHEKKKLSFSLSQLIKLHKLRSNVHQSFYYRLHSSSSSPSRFAIAHQNQFLIPSLHYQSKVPKMNDLMTKSFTSYVDLKKAAMKDVDLEAGMAVPPDVELTSSITHLDTDMGLFLEEAEKVKTEMGSLRDILGSLQQANEESKSLHKAEALKALRSRINADIVAVLKKARTIRTQLEEMDRANAANRRLSGLKDGTPAIYRTRIAVTNGLRKKLKELMMEFQGLRQRMMSEYKDTVGRR